MKQILLIALGVLTAMLSCKKEIERSPEPAHRGVSIFKDSTGTSLFAAPVANALIGSFRFQVSEGMNLERILVRIRPVGLGVFKTAMLAKLSVDLSGLGRSGEDSIIDGVATFSVAGSGRGYTDGVYYCRLYADILSGAVGQFVTEVAFVYDGGKRLPWSTGQVQTVQAAPLKGVLSTKVLHSPTTDTVGSNISMITFAASAVGQDLTINRMRVWVSDPAVLSKINLVEGTKTFQETVGSSNEIDIKNIDINITKGTTKNLSFDIELKKFGYDVQVKIIRIEYEDALGEDGRNDTVRSSNAIRTFKSLPSISSKQATNKIVNDQRMDLHGVTVKALGEKVTLKQLAFTIEVNDVITGDDLSIDQFQMKSGGTVLAGFFTKEDGSEVSSLPEGVHHLYFTFASESVIAKDQSTTYMLSGVPHGFLHALDIDFVLVGLLGDQSVPIDHRILNRGTATSRNARLSNTRVTNAAAVISSVIWSDYSAVNHSSVLGASSDDWFNANRLLVEPGESVLIQ